MSIALAQKIKELERRIVALEEARDAPRPTVTMTVNQRREPPPQPPLPVDDDPLLVGEPPRGIIRRR